MLAVEVRHEFEMLWEQGLLCSISLITSEPLEMQRHRVHSSDYSAVAKEEHLNPVII